MSELDRKKNVSIQADDEDGSGDFGGQAIAFADFIGLGEPLRDAVLPQDQKKQLIQQHLDKSRQSVQKQKAKRDFYARAKMTSQKQPGLSGQLFAGNEATGLHKQHPLLAKYSQVVDPAVAADPTLFQGQTNDEDQHRLTHEFQLTNKPELQPQLQAELKATPKLKPF